MSKPQPTPESVPQPVGLEKSPDRQLQIRWSDGEKQAIPFKTLRDSCQCATCMEKRTNQPDQPVGQLTILSAAEAMPVDITSMTPVGNYAYNIHFSDGHTTGIFTFEALRGLGLFSQ